MTRLLSLLSLISLLLVSCDKGIRLEKQPKTELTFSQLPDTVKYYYSRIDSIKSDSSESKIFCLDANHGDCDYEIKWIASFVDKYVFHIDNKTLTMEFNGNSINEPYIIYKKELYFIKTLNVYDIEEIRAAEYGKFDLRDVLNKNGG